MENTDFSGKCQDTLWDATLVARIIPRVCHVSFAKLRTQPTQHYEINYLRHTFKSLSFPPLAAMVPSGLQSMA